MAEEQQSQVQKPKKSIFKKWWFWAIIVYLFIVMVFPEDDEARERRLTESRAREEARAEQRLAKEAERATIEEARAEQRLAKEAERANEKAKETYRNEVTDIMLTNAEALDIVIDTFRMPSSFWAQKEVVRVAYASVIIDGNYLAFKELSPPDDYKEHFLLFLSGLAELSEAMATMRAGIDSRNSDKMKQAARLYEESRKIFNRAGELLK